MCFPGVLKRLSPQNKGGLRAQFLQKGPDYTCNPVFQKGGSYETKLLFSSPNFCPDRGHWPVCHDRGEPEE